MQLGLGLWIDSDRGGAGVPAPSDVMLWDATATSYLLWDADPTSYLTWE